MSPFEICLLAFIAILVVRLSLAVHDINKVNTRTLKLARMVRELMEADAKKRKK